MGPRDLSDETTYYGIRMHGYIYALVASSAYLAINILGISNLDTEQENLGWRIPIIPIS